jgi:NADH-quinone oxidoreductase subunit H
MQLSISLLEITRAIDSWLNSAFHPHLAFGIELVLAGVAVILLVVVMAILMVYAERKLAGFMQMRLGPMRVGKYGSMQAVADVMKLLLKECLTPTNSDKLMFRVAPFVVTIVSFMTLVPIAFAKGIQLWDITIGVFYITAVSSLSVIGILMAGWSSNNKYSLLGAMRSGAQIVSYELSGGLALIVVVMMSGTLSISGIVQAQADGWWLIKGHIPVLIAFVTFIITSTAELNRAPFDLAEAESELTAGYHTEYSGMQFAMFFLSEYTNMFVLSMVAATVFLGGWMPFHLAGLDGLNHIMDYIPGIVWFFGKTFFILFLIVWFRWTFPRLRIDQLLKLEWKYLLPISIINVLFAAFIALMGWYL